MPGFPCLSFKAAGFGILPFMHCLSPVAEVLKHILAGRKRVAPPPTLISRMRTHHYAPVLLCVLPDFALPPPLRLFTIGLACMTGRTQGLQVGGVVRAAAPLGQDVVDVGGGPPTHDASGMLADVHRAQSAPACAVAALCCCATVAVVGLCLHHRPAHRAGAIAHEPGAVGLLARTRGSVGHLSRSLFGKRHREPATAQTEEEGACENKRSDQSRHSRVFNLSSAHKKGRRHCDDGAYSKANQVKYQDMAVCATVPLREFLAACVAVQAGAYASLP